MKTSQFIKSAKRRFSKQCVLFLILAGVAPTYSYATPDCNPQSIVGRAVGGALLNQIIGGLSKIGGGLAGVQNGISPTPSGLMGDCILPRLNPNPPSGYDPSPVSGPSRGWGDPHLISHDGLGFDFQGAGDYAYVESADLIVQARQFRLSRDAAVSRLKAFAIRFDDRTIVINDPIDASLIGSEPGLLDVVTVDGIDMPIGLGGWIDLDTHGSFIMRFHSHTYVMIQGKLRMLISDDGNTFELLLDTEWQGKVTGMLGNFDGDPSNDLVTESGTNFNIADSDTLYGAFLDGWLRQGEESLFNSAFDPATSGEFKPSVLLSLSDTDLSIRETAAQRCKDAGVSQGFALHGCIYDMVFDEDEKWLKDAAEVADDGLDIVPASALASPDNVAIALAINASVSPMKPTDAAGILGAANEVDLYTITIPTDSPRVLQPVAPCSDAQQFSLLLEQDDVPAVEYSLSCNVAVPLPTGQMALSVFSHGGDTGNYSFNILEPANTDLGVIALDTLIQGTLAPRERLHATLPSIKGDRVFIISNQDESCGQRWNLINVAGTLIKTTSTCLDLGLVVLEDNTPYSLQIQQSAASSFGFAVLSVGEDTVNIPGGNDRQFDLTIATAGQRASAIFPLLQGDRIFVDREGGVLNGTLIVNDPDGFEVIASRAHQEDIRFEANSNGNYTLTLQPNDSFVGVVPISLISVADDIHINVNRGQTFTMTLSTLGQRAVASFDAIEGDVFTVTATTTNSVSGGSAIPAIQLPGDEQSLAIFGSRTFTALVTGTYQIELNSPNFDNFVGAVEFEIR